MSGSQYGRLLIPRMRGMTMEAGQPGGGPWMVCEERLLATNGQAFLAFIPLDAKPLKIIAPRGTKDFAAIRSGSKSHC